MNPLCRPAQYLLRVDDLCPTVDQANWRRIRSIVESHNIRPMLAVVPDNRDQQLDVSPADDTFWAQVGDMQAAGATIALHGWQHLCSSRGGSLVRVARLSEFAGRSEAEQRLWICAGKQILRKQGLEPRLFIAPRHGFDRVTLRILKAEGIAFLSDGMARRAFQRYGMTWIPQQLWSPLHKSSGLWTICIHPNTMRDADLDELERFASCYAGQFTSFERVTAESCSELGVIERIWEGLAMLRFQIRHHPAETEEVKHATEA